MSLFLPPFSNHLMVSLCFGRQKASEHMAPFIGQRPSSKHNFYNTLSSEWSKVVLQLFKVKYTWSYFKIYLKHSMCSISSVHFYSVDMKEQGRPLLFIYILFLQQTRSLHGRNSYVSIEFNVLNQKIKGLVLKMNLSTKTFIHVQFQLKPLSGVCHF